MNMAHQSKHSLVRPFAILGYTGLVAFLFSACFAASVLAIPQATTESPRQESADPNKPDVSAPFDLFNQPIDKMKIYRHYERTATKMLQAQPKDAVSQLQAKLKNVQPQCNVSLGSLQASSVEAAGGVYKHMVKSTLYIGELYDCGRCERIHAGFAGGVLIGQDGLALTNHHVIKSRDTGKTVGLFAMTYDGRCWPIKEILAGSARDDVALIRLDGKGHTFHAAKLAATAPLPTEKIRVISHPYGEFYLMTEGEVSRYSKIFNRRNHGKPDPKRPASWMEITADFGSGSSGCGVFNERGEVVGVVSTIRPLIRNPKSEAANSGKPANPRSTKFVEVLIRMCVPHQSIRRLFAD